MNKTNEIKKYFKKVMDSVTPTSGYEHWIQIVEELEKVFDLEEEYKIKKLNWKFDSLEKPKKEDCKNHKEWEMKHFFHQIWRFSHGDEQYNTLKRFFQLAFNVKNFEFSINSSNDKNLDVPKEWIKTFNEMKLNEIETFFL